MKGLRKGFRYISQIFEDDKEPEIQIGFPTDVKHVAHIGNDGPSASAPSWMTNFKSEPDFTSSGLTLPEGAARGSRPPKPPSEDLSIRRSRAASEAAASDMPDLPKARRHASHNDITDERSEKTSRPEKTSGRRSRKHHPGDESSSCSAQTILDLSQGLPAREIPRKTRRKKNKDLTISGSARSSSKDSAASSPSCGYASPYSDPGSGTLHGSSLMDGGFSGSSSPNLPPFGLLEEKV